MQLHYKLIIETPSTHQVRVIIEGKKAKGIILNTGEKIYGNNIITNCTDFVTFNKLINQKELNPRVK